MVAKRHAPWTSEWSMACMRLEQAGITFKHSGQERAFKEAVGQFLFDANGLLEKAPEPFTLEQLGLAFMTLAVGLALGPANLICEMGLIVKALKEAKARMKALVGSVEKFMSNNFKG